MLPAITWAAGILWLGSRPYLGSGVELPGADKVAHMGLFAGLGYLTARARGGAAPTTPAAAWLGLAALVGVIDELNQLRVAGRSADPFDVAADVAGVVLGFSMFHWTHRERHAPDT